MSGREKGLMLANPGRVDMSHYKLLTDTQHAHKHKSEQRPWGKTQPQSQGDKRQGRMLLISIHGPFFAALLFPFVEETLPPIGDTQKHMCQGANLNLCICLRASTFQIDWQTGSLRSAWEPHIFLLFFRLPYGEDLPVGIYYTTQITG